MTHLSADERLDLIEADDQPAHLHLASCARCRAEVVDAREMLRHARSVEIPEPSPLFWDALSRRVSEKIAAAEPEYVRGGWRFWRLLIPLTAVVGALLVAVDVERGSRSADPVSVPAVVSGEQGNAVSAEETGDVQWTLLADLAAEFDLETLSDSLGMSAAGGADSAVWQLNEREKAELAALLRAELQQQP